MHLKCIFLICVDVSKQQQQNNRLILITEGKHYDFKGTVIAPNDLPFQVICGAAGEMSSPIDSCFIMLLPHGDILTTSSCFGIETY